MSSDEQLCDSSNTVSQQVLKFPEAFIQYLVANGVDPAIFQAPLTLPRYLRTNPRRPISDSELEDHFPGILPVKSLPTFFELPGHIKIARVPAYVDGLVYGIDLSSGWVVHALDPIPGDHVLDLCCAPGAKLAMIADRMELSGVLVGVDVNTERLNVCRAILKKYGALDFVKLEDADGQEFSSVSLFDKVLVDAECTHDGSIKHLQKFGTQWGWDTFERRVMNPGRLSSLQRLQRNLLVNGFSLLKPGGTLVYATCSFCKAQNEEIVQYLLLENSNAFLLPTDILDETCSTRGVGALRNTVRFNPVASRSSGMFIARIGKLFPNS